MGLTNQVIVHAAQSSVPPALAGRATTTITFSRSLGQTVGTAVFGAVIAGSLGNARPGLVPSVGISAGSYVDAVRAMFLVALAVAVALLVATAALRDDRLD
jgi:hypothetical protein